MKKALKIICDVLTFGIPLLIRALYAWKRNAVVRAINDATLVKVVKHRSSDRLGDVYSVELTVKGIVIPIEVDLVEEVDSNPQKGATYDK